MSTVANVVALAKLYGDYDSTRFTDPELALLVGQAVQRVNHLFYQNDIALGTSLYTFDTIPGESVYPLPVDYMAPAQGLYRSDLKQRLELIGTDDWEQRGAPGEMRYWRVWDGDVYIAGTPNGIVGMNLYYFPIVDTSEYTTSTEMPWDGKMDAPIARYMFMLAANIDEMDVTFDSKILADIEALHLNTYSSGTPNNKNVQGWA